MDAGRAVHGGAEAGLTANRPLILAVLVVVVAQAALTLAVAPWVFEGVRTLDGDVALRLDRVMELHGGGAWYDSVAERLDAPFGELVNWARPLDVVLYAGAAVLAPLADFRTALVVWGALLSPLLLIACLPVLQATLAPLLGRQAVLPAAILLALQMKLMHAFQLGRADHHAALLLLFAVLLLALSRAALGATGRRPALLAGSAAGLGCWISVEATVAAGFAGLAWLLLWIASGDRRRLGQMLAYGATATAVLALAVAAEHPPGDWLRPLYAKVSIVHASLAALGTLAVAALRAAPPGATAAGRALRAAGAGVAAAAAAVILFPALPLGPLAADWAGTGALHLRAVAEFQPLWPTDTRRAAFLLLHLGLPLAALACCVALLRRRPERTLLAVWLLGLLVYLPLTLMQVRWAGYPQLLMIVPLLMAHHDFAPRAATAAPAPGGKAMLLVPVAVVMLAAALALPQRPRPPAGCDKAEMLRHLAAQPPAPGRDVLLTYASDGPEVIWNSRYRVVSATYLFDTGLAAAVAALRSPDDGALRALAARRGIAWVLVCAANPEARSYRVAGGPSLHDRLAGGDAPDWLRPVPLPEHLRPHLLYRTVEP